MRRVFALLIALVVCFQTAAVASSHSSDGTEFRFSCLPTLHSTADTIFLVLTSAYTSSGSVEYVSSQGQNIRKPFVVTDPRRAVYVAIPHADVELQGNHHDSTTFLVDQTERVLHQQVLSIHCDSAVSASVLINGSAGSSVTPLIPLSSCGRSYIISTASSRVVLDSALQPSKSLSSPGQFVIVATEDATTITIDLKGRSSHGSESRISIQLNANDCYFVQGTIDTSTQVSDLSATQILADKPLVVISGHEGAQLPSHPGFASPGARNGSIIQQLTSVDRWGTEFVLIPTKTTEASLHSGSEYVRVYAIQSGTELSIDGTLITTLQNGEFTDLELNDPHVLRSNAAVGVMQYCANDVAVDQQLGNAAMFTVTSVQQWTVEHTICALQPKLSSGKTFTSQYVLVVAPTSAMNSVLYDGEPAANNLVSVANSRYSYFIRKIADGIHNISCDSACEVLVYGFASDRRYVNTSDLAFPIRAYMKPSVHVPDLSANIGDTVMVSVVIDSLQLPPAILGLQPASYSFDLCFNSTILTPAEVSKRGPIVNGLQVIHVSDTLSQVSAAINVLGLQMICGLGDAEECKMQVDNLHWYTPQGDTILLDYTPAFGLFRLKNVWHDHDGARLVNPQPGDIQLDVTPNPMKGRVFITCTSDIVSSQNPTLILYNPMGEVVKDFSDEVRGFSRVHQFLYGMQEFAPGVYYLRFAFAEKSAVIMIVNE